MRAALTRYRERDDSPEAEAAATISFFSCRVSMASIRASGDGRIEMRLRFPDLAGLMGMAALYGQSGRGGKFRGSRDSLHS
jgi:hypothetical protein